MSVDTNNLTVLLRQWAQGDRSVEDEVFEIVEPELRRIARRLLRREPGQSMESVDLVNEVYMRILKARNQDWRDRGHFYALMARMMRRYLIDRARARPKVIIHALEDVANWLPGQGNDLGLVLTIDRLLTDLEKESPELCQVVELKFFLGLGDREAAQALRVSERTFQRRWLDAKVWLAKRLGVSNAAKHSG
jgi:RNA polymerase sigma factor (TIGR02999 family)